MTGTYSYDAENRLIAVDGRVAHICERSELMWGFAPNLPQPY